MSATVHQLKRSKPIERRTDADKAWTVLRYLGQVTKAMEVLASKGLCPVSVVIDQTRPRIYIAHHPKALNALDGYGIGRRQVTNGIVCRRYGATLHEVQIIWEEESKC
jgi:hypothetical protein